MEPHILKKLEHDAIDFALSSNWAGALESNIEILSSFPQNVPALLRAGFASFQLKSLTESQKYYQKVIDLQPQNPIASEYIEKIQVMLDNHSPTSKSVSSIDPSIFVEYPGKTKLATLSQLGQKNVLAKLVVGDQVLLAVRKRHVEARTSTDEYIGILPDDIGTRLIYFIEHESAYTAHIHSSNMSSVAIFIREIQKGKKVDRMASFPIDIPGSIAHVMATQQQDEIDKEEGTSKGDQVDLLSPEALDIDEKETSHEELEESLMGEVDRDEKPEEDEVLLGIETDDQEDEEEE